MKKIAITGSIACGKSTILNHLSKKFPVFNCDEAIKNLYQNPEIIEKIKKKFSIQDPSKQTILNIIKQNPYKLKQLEAILYPKLHKIMQEFEQKSRRTSKITYFEVPLLLEKNLTHKYHHTIVLHSPKWKRKKNFINRGGNNTMFQFFNSYQWNDTKKISISQKKHFTLISLTNKNISYKTINKCTHI